MPASVHKLLVHDSAIISSVILPIGLLSEEAQEARNKDCKYNREHNTRKCSRIATNDDLFRSLLISSDPIITSLRRIPHRKGGSIPQEVKDLLLEPVIPDNEPEDESSAESE